MTTIDLGNLTVVANHVVGFEKLPDNRWKMLTTCNYTAKVDTATKDQIIAIINQAV